MIDQTPYTETEQEIIVLRAVWDMIDGMVNYEIFDKRHGTVNAVLRFKSISTKRLFNIHLVDFLSRPKPGLFDLPEPEGQEKTDFSFLYYLRRICSNPKLNPKSDIIFEPVEQLINWLEEECFVENVWFPSVPIETDIRVKRIIFLKICGDIAKHNFARLDRIVDRVIKVLEVNEVKIDAGQGFLLLPEFYEWFHENILGYHASTIAEYLNNIRWGIFDYLGLEFARSYEKAEPEPIGYRFKFPVDCQDSLAKAMYWDLMNQVRSRPYFPRFAADEMLKRRY